MITQYFHRSFTAVGLTALLVLTTSCNVTTANLSSLKVGKDANVSAEADTFAPKDTIYAVATVSNVPSKVTVKIETTYDEPTDGKPSYHIADLDKSFDVDSSSTVTYNIAPPPNGWPAGKYHLTASMYVEGGEKKDEKTAGFTVEAP